MPAASGRSTSRSSMASPWWRRTRSASGSAGRVVGLRGVEDLVAGQVGLGRQPQHLGEVVDVDVAPEAGARLVALAADDRPEVVLDVALPLHPRRAHRDAADVRAADGGVHELLAEDLRRGVRVLRAQRVLLVDGQVVGQEGPLGEEPARRRLRGDVDEARRSSQRTAASSALNVDITLLWKTTCAGLLGRLRDRRRVDHRVVAAHDREGRAGVGEVGLHVRGLSGVGALEDRRPEVGRGHVVAGGEQGVDGRAADLAAAAGDEDAHGAQPSGVTPVVFGGPLAWWRAGPVAGHGLRLRRLRLRACPAPPARTPSLPGRAPPSASRSASVYCLRGRSSCAGPLRQCSPPEYRAAVVRLRVGEPTGAPASCTAGLEVMC